jgi:lipoic acid synthetase
MATKNNHELRKPKWLRARVAQGPNCARLEGIMREGDLHTVCEEAMCPNKGVCWEKGRATLMILGGVCSRGCLFCNVKSGAPAPPDRDEPGRAAEAVKAMGLDEVVITSVTRDDVEDGGAAIWAETIRLVKQARPGIMVEVLVPDFNGDYDALDAVLEAGPDILGHNLETVPSLYEQVRPGAVYHRSLEILKRAHDAGFVTKTGLMVGLGETAEEVLEVMDDARECGCHIFFVGQYLRPSKAHLPVRRYVEPGEFEAYRLEGLKKGFAVVVSEPLVRSSFHSDLQTEFVKQKQGAV